MTDQSNEMDRAERIRRLQARRAATAHASRAADPTATAGEGAPAAGLPPRPASRRSKRGHPAAATRWTLAGLSVASFFTIAGAVAVADQTAAGSPPPATPQAPAGPTPEAYPTAPAPSATPRSIASSGNAAPAPHTTTRGS
jgi:hypothetical protein